ncbi:hypothetical protein ZHAS_00001089 [Anopheles sinensis]|uniref:Uncharacterized protein n=1 Tax=Anopheles sinensis TaxID=74873 RepID=A0A084VB18_ANOSI|nr:hypothetical protein ZHAS_00001089 [Anopheles sinensis]
MENTRNETTRSYAGSEGSESETSSPRANPTIVDRELELARKRFALERRAFEIDISRRELELEELAIAIEKGMAQREPAKFPTAPSDQQAEAAMAPGHSSSLYTAPSARPAEAAMAPGHSSSQYTAPGARTVESAMAQGHPSSLYTAPGVRPAQTAMAPNHPSSVHPAPGERPVVGHGSSAFMTAGPSWRCAVSQMPSRQDTYQERQSQEYARWRQYLDEFHYSRAGRSQPATSERHDAMAAPAAENGRRTDRGRKQHLRATT